MFKNTPTPENHRQCLIKAATFDIAKNLTEIEAASLSVWDRSMIAKAHEIKRAVELKELQAELRRIMELAGLNYNIEKQNFWRRYHTIKQRNKSQD